MGYTVYWCRPCTHRVIGVEFIYLVWKSILVLLNDVRDVDKSASKVVCSKGEGFTDKRVKIVYVVGRWDLESIKYKYSPTNT